MKQRLTHIILVMVMVVGAAVSVAQSSENDLLAELPPLDIAEPGRLEIALFGLG